MTFPATDPSTPIPAQDEAPVSVRIQDAALEAPSVSAKRRRSGALWFELLVVSWFYLLPEIVSVIVRLAYPPAPGAATTSASAGPAYTFYSTHVWTLTAGSSCLLLLLFVVSRSAEGWAAFGLARPRWRRDLLLTAALVPAMFLIVWGISLMAFRALPTETYHELRRQVGYGIRSYFSAPRGAAQVLVAAASCLMTGFREELLMRSYLISRLETLTRSTTVSVAISVVVFAILHNYQGVMGIVATGAIGLLLSLAYCWTRRVWPVAIAHACFNFISLLRL